MPRNDLAVKDQMRAARGGNPSLLPPATTSLASSEEPRVSGKRRILVFPGNNNGDGPQPTDPTPHHGPRLLSGGVMECVAIDMANRWWNYETSIVTIRRKLNVSIPEAERIVRRGMRLREKKAA